MSSADASSSPEPTLAPEDVSDRTFPTAFRGFDPVEVRAFLGRVADELTAARQRETELRALLDAAGGAGGAQHAVEEAEAAAAAITAKAAEEAAAALSEARDEADRLVREAKERVAQLGHAATAESARVLEEAREQAKHVVRVKAEEAESVAVKKIADAEREAASIRVKAREDADAILEAAKERGREMIAEAQAARERMIADLNKRKRAAAAQLDQLRAGRDRLLESLRVVRRNLDEITTRLEATEGVAPPVAATPDSPATEGSSPPSNVTKVPAAQPQEARRPVRASRVVLGELPSSSPPASHAGSPASPVAPASPPPKVVSTTPDPADDDRPNVVSVRSTPGALTPRIDAPQARAVAGGEPAPVDEPGAAGGESRPQPPQEERKSSALRILRRNRGGGRGDPRATPVQVGRDSPGEGIRIIKDPQPEQQVERLLEQPATAPEPVVDHEPDVEPEPAPAPEPDQVADAEPTSSTEIVEAHVVEDTAPSGDTAPSADADAAEIPEVVVDVGVVERADEDDADDAQGRDSEPGADIAPDDLPPPLRPEEVRPRIEDLFARIRADREQAVAKARAVLAADDDAVDHIAPADHAEPSGDHKPVAEPAADSTEPVAGGDDAAAAPTSPDDADEHLLQARDVIVDPLVGQLTRRLKRSIQDEQNATLDRLRTSRPRPGGDDVLASADTQPAPYRYAALPILEEAARAASAAAPFGAVGVGVDDLAQALAEDIAVQIRTKVDRVLRDAADEDVDLQTASERVSSVYREWKTQRVERVASYHLIAAWSRGTFVATPEGTPMRWIVDDDGPCPDCDDNALAGPTSRGQAYPTGQLHPPAHPGCRCLLVPLHS